MAVKFPEVATSFKVLMCLKTYCCDIHPPFQVLLLLWQCYIHSLIQTCLITSSWITKVEGLSVIFILPSWCFFLSICVFVGYPNIVATYGRGYTGFSPSYSYQFPGEFVCLIFLSHYETANCHVIQHHFACYMHTCEASVWQCEWMGCVCVC